jgi:hypothetical protein
MTTTVPDMSNFRLLPTYVAQPGNMIIDLLSTDFRYGTSRPYETIEAPVPLLPTSVAAGATSTKDSYVVAPGGVSDCVGNSVRITNSKACQIAAAEMGLFYFGKTRGFPAGCTSWKTVESIVFFNEYAGPHENNDFVDNNVAMICQVPASSSNATTLAKQQMVTLQGSLTFFIIHHGTMLNESFAKGVKSTLASTLGVEEWRIDVSGSRDVGNSFAPISHFLPAAQRWEFDYAVKVASEEAPLVRVITEEISQNTQNFSGLLMQNLVSDHLYLPMCVGCFFFHG